MEPIAFIQSLLKINRAGAAFIMTGLGVIAASAVAVSWLGSGQNVIALAILILIFAAVVAVLSFIVTNPLMKTVLGWMFILGFGFIMSAAMDSVVQVSGRIPYPVCLRSILEEPPNVCMERFAQGTPLVTVAAAAVPEPSSPGTDTRDVNPAPVDPAPIEETMMPFEPPPGVVQADARIVLHFVPPVTRATAQAAAVGLQQSGWVVEGGQDGGEEIARGPSVTQIRVFNPAFAEHAAWLAADLSRTLGDAAVDVRDFSNSGLLAPRNLLEIWIAPEIAS